MAGSLVQNCIVSIGLLMVVVVGKEANSTAAICDLPMLDTGKKTRQNKTKPGVFVEGPSFK